MTIEEMRERKAELNYTDAQIAQRADLPLEKVQKIFSEEAPHLDYPTWIALEQALGKWSHSMVSETAAPYSVKKQGEYTLDDYYRIPDDHRVELIDGVIYDMGAPTSAHQLIAGFLYSQFFNHAAKNKGPCLPMISPLDVQLDCDNRTMVQPDVIIVCDRDKVINRCVYGAPDLVIEVLSPSSRRKDTIVKLAKYKNAGVREFWLIDPDKQKVTVYLFETDTYPTIYGFNSKVPVGIWNNECKIDFREVYEYIRFLYERK